MNEEKEKLLFEVLHVLLMQDSMVIDSIYQDELIKKCKEVRDYNDKKN